MFSTMKGAVIVLVACVAGIMKVTQGHESPLFNKVEACLKDYNITVEGSANSTAEQEYCINGCVLQAFDLMSSSGNLNKEKILADIPKMNSTLMEEIISKCNSNEILVEDAKKSACEVAKCLEVAGYLDYFSIY